MGIFTKPKQNGVFLGRLIVYILENNYTLPTESTKEKESKWKERKNGGRDTGER